MTNLIDLQSLYPALVSDVRWTASVLIQYAMVVLRHLVQCEARNNKEQWLKALVQRRGTQIAVVALDNKTVRTALTMLNRQQEYQTAGCLG